MSFAVVADEVRNLSQRCFYAAKDTAALIEESIARSRQGSAKLDPFAGAMRAITGSAAEVKGTIDEVNRGGQEQSRGRTVENAEENATCGEELPDSP